MTSLRLPTLRQLAQRTRLKTAAPQRRWAQVHDVRFLATTPRQLQILDKYRAKLDEKARAEGHATLEDLKAAYAEKIKEQWRRDAEAPPGVKTQNGVKGPPGGEIDPNKPAGAPDIPQAPDTSVIQPNAGRQPGTDPTEPPAPSSIPEHIPQAPDTPVKQPNANKAESKTGVKTLDEIINVEKCRTLSEEALTAAWRLRYASSPNSLCASISASTYRAMEEQARRAPQFVLPVPHPESGAEMHFLQWTFDATTKTSTVLFTQLAEYKVRGEFAQPHTTVTHHLDLMDEAAGVVLMQGQVVSGRGVDTEQAKWLVMCLQKFYGGWTSAFGELTGERKQRAEERRKLLEWFAAGDERFSVDKLLDEAERMG